MVLLIALAVIGVRARQGAPLDSGARQAAGGTWVRLAVSFGGLAVGTVTLAAVLLTAWRIARRLTRERDKDNPPHVVQRPVTGLGAHLAALAAALVVIGMTIGAMVLGARVAGNGRGGAATPVRTVRPSPPPVHTGPSAGHAGASGPELLWLLIAGLLVLAVIAVIVARVCGGRPVEAVAVVPSPVDTSPSPRKRRSPYDDARSAVIADYAAMERELAPARLRRAPYETAVELLDRARSAGFETAQARELAQLFAVARFSTRPVSTGQRERAGRSLAAVRRQWADRTGTTTAAAPGEERP